MNMLFVLFFSLSLSLCGATSPVSGTALIQPQPLNFNSSFDGLLSAEWVSPPPEVRWIEGTLQWPPQDQEETSCDYSYHTIFQKLQENILEDGKKLWLGGHQQLTNFSTNIYNLSRALASDACTLLIDSIIFLWSFILWGVVWCVFRFVKTYFLRALTIAFLVACTACMAKCLRALSGLLAPFPRLLLSVINFIYSVFLGMLTPFQSSKTRKTNCWEKQLKGWNSFEIPMNPPSKSVIEITYDNGSHCGYAVTVQTYKKTASGAFESAVLTSLHCLDGGDEKFLFSRRTGQGIPLAQCTTLAVWKSLDLCLLTPPANFQSTLGVKPCPMVCMDRLAGCDASFFRLNKEGAWSMTNCKLLGAQKDGSVAVLVNSQPGHSGSPFFNGKNVLGVLRGPDPDNNFNIMNPIPAVEGLTVPELRFETTAPTGKLFTDDNLMKALAEEYTRMKNFVPASGKAWADYDSDEEYFEAAAKDLAGPSTLQGNEEGRPDCQINGAPADFQKMMQEMMEKMISNISLEGIKETAAEKLAEKLFHMNKPAPKKNRRSRRPSKQRTSDNISTASTSGTYVPPHRKSPGSVTADTCPNSTGPGKRPRRNGGKPSPKNIPHWVRRQEGSAGPSSGRPRS
ncbi:P1 [Pepo aphid-borne yellows virus]|uniref:p1 n=1 Tax=Pepo aphid-borne yellows virus TaxID=1462681 RepID=A0A172ZPM7_9VIRU|nr:P1 [Pepo aphid-borne yellows virus]ANF99518.1 P1 [Pepo aphid-borne yellows virus]